MSKFKEWKRKVIAGCCFTSALFVFQACYGTPRDFGNDLLIHGVVKAKKSGEPIKGIKVFTKNQYGSDLTNEKGEFGFYVPSLDQVTVRFADVDSTENGLFLHKDTTFSISSNMHFLEVFLDEE